MAGVGGATTRSAAMCLVDAGAGVATGGGGLGEHPGYLKVAEHGQEWGDSSAVADEAASEPGGREVQPIHAGLELRETEQLGAALHAAEDTDVLVPSVKMVGT